MNADKILHAARDAARRRRGIDIGLHALPWLGVLLALAWRTHWSPAWLALCTLAVAGSAWLVWRETRHVDAQWLARGLDAQRSDMDDSAALLFVEDASRNALQQLQRARLQQRLESAPPPDLRPAWRVRTLAAYSVVALALILGLILWPAQRASAPSGALPASGAATNPLALPRLVRQRLDIQPPTYTRLPSRSGTMLDAKAPESATLRWSLRFAPNPATAQLVFHNGQRLALRRDGDDWIVSRRIDRPTLYRIELPTPLPAAQSVLHRIDVIADRPPQLRALQPDRNLTIRAASQRGWKLLFEADDEYGLAPNAQLHITQTAGSGENITASERTLAIAGAGNATRRRYARTLDLAMLGLTPGNDLIVQLDIADNRSPRPQRTRGPSFILRWPPEAATEVSGMEGLVKQTLPASLRSQRQIIIDAEALQKQKRQFDAARFLQRSDEIGVDQHALRMRYGQFLGEESEGAPRLPTNDAPDATIAQADKFGDAGAVVEEYGHVHDLPEAATLLDPGTKELLRAALDQMWQSELKLRQGSPDAALPFAYKALGFIKQVQQASRIYLARTGIEPPPIDASRRLSGDRAGLGDRGDILSATTTINPVPATAWLALQQDPATDRAEPDCDALERWARTHSANASDPLALFAAIDGARREPDCDACRERLRRALWPLLAQPPASIEPRTQADENGRAYLDALGRGDAR